MLPASGSPRSTKMLTRVPSSTTAARGSYGSTPAMNSRALSTPHAVHPHGHPDVQKHVKAPHRHDPAGDEHAQPVPGGVGNVQGAPDPQQEEQQQERPAAEPQFLPDDRNS